jgi:peptide-methionine (S)-S-oxide reductase
VKGVSKVEPGFSGGKIKNPPYREVVQGRTGHAEAIKITYDESIISYRNLLEVFMATHDPTTLNRQAYDVGTHYRSGIFYMDEDQEQIARSYVEELDKSGEFNDPIVTEIAKATAFYPAEKQHENYYNNNRAHGYCRAIIDPKIRKLMSKHGDLAVQS